MTSITATPARFPGRMRSKRRWIGWIWGERGTWRRFDRPTLKAHDGHLWRVDGQGVMTRADKLPKNVRTGRAASVSDPETWSTFDEAFDALRRGLVDGCGYVLDEGEVMVDLDGCMKGGEPDEFARSVIAKLDSYAERSVSGEGIHVIVVADGFVPNRGVKAARTEVYAGGHTNRYCTVSGDVLCGCDELNDDAEDVLSDFYQTEFARNPIVSADAAQRDRAIMDEVRSTTLTDDDARSVAWVCGHYKHGRAMYQRGDYLGWAKDRTSYARLMRQGGSPDVSASAADAALTSYLLAATEGDADRTLALLHASGMYRPKFDEVHDGAHTYAIMTVARVSKRVDVERMRTDAIARRDAKLKAAYPHRLDSLVERMRKDDVTDRMLRHVMAHHVIGKAQRNYSEPVSTYPDALVDWIVDHWGRVAELAYRFDLRRARQ